MRKCQVIFERALSYLEQCPDYMTQGETLEELKENLKDIHKELTSGNIPCVRRVAELEVGGTHLKNQENHSIN